MGISFLIAYGIIAAIVYAATVALVIVAASNGADVLEGNRYHPDRYSVGSLVGLLLFAAVLWPLLVPAILIAFAAGRTE